MFSKAMEQDVQCKEMDDWLDYLDIQIKWKSLCLDLPQTKASGFVEWYAMCLINE